MKTLRGPGRSRFDVTFNGIIFAKNVTATFDLAVYDLSFRPDTDCALNSYATNDSKAGQKISSVLTGISAQRKGSMTCDFSGHVTLFSS